MSTAPTVRFHHISLSVADLPALEAWYGRAFGLDRVEERLELPDAGVRTVVLSNPGDPDGLRVELVQRPGSEPAAPADAFAATAVQTYTHLALHVADLDAAFARLTGECGAAPVSSPAPGVTDGMRYAYVADPEGNLLELIGTTAPSGAGPTAEAS
ncbi:VOC family protein [Actinacidiphila guanduensis]|uniref:Catechol 2,3-dioxygenase n=1 Tax=Actinacidiphila guanduensis TaxID=310781 RepID=A0A1G9XB28_9ACTN|nr:VOC family protein [Actinacidiphila guanduensis]SDM94002.1 Catechol 2,3-dioxygenase [Actinacidiphila guanduensis]